VRAASDGTKRKSTTSTNASAGIAGVMLTWHEGQQDEFSVADRVERF
jgi:hypothetical protein